MSIRKTGTINFGGNREILRSFYEKNGLEIYFKNDIDYIEKSFDEIYEFWRTNFDQIKKINYLMIAEAPLWGINKKYIYNPATNNSQFFYRRDLGNVIGEMISTKQEFLKVCNKIGLLVLDISPYPLNQTDTAINYRETNIHSKGLTGKQYRELIKLTLPEYFEKLLELISNKKSSEIKVFFRYQRLKENFEDLIIPILIEHEFIQSKNDIGNVSQKGGCINKLKLSNILNLREIKKEGTEWY